MGLVVPFLLIILTNWSVLKTANHLQADIVRVCTHADSADTSYKRGQGEFVNARRPSMLAWSLGNRALLSPHMDNHSLQRISQNAKASSRGHSSHRVSVLSWWVRCATHLSIPFENETFEKVWSMCSGGLEFVHMLTTSSRLHFVVGFSVGNMIYTNKRKSSPRPPVKDVISMNGFPTPRCSILKKHAGVVILPI